MRNIALSLAGATGFVEPPNRGTFHLGMLWLAKMEITMRGTAICLAGALALGLGTAASAASLTEQRIQGSEGKEPMLG